MTRELYISGRVKVKVKKFIQPVVPKNMLPGSLKHVERSIKRVFYTCTPKPSVQH